MIDEAVVKAASTLKQDGRSGTFQLCTDGLFVFQIFFPPFWAKPFGSSATADRALLMWKCRPRQNLTLALISADIWKDCDRLSVPPMILNGPYLFSKVQVLVTRGSALQLL